MKLEMVAEQEEAESIEKLGKEVVQAIEAWENKLIQPRQKTFQDVINFENQLNAELNMLRSRIDTYDPRLTSGSLERFDELTGQWNTLKTEKAQIISEEIGSFNARYRQLDLPALIMPASQE
jgi:hypothetical protein